MSADDPRAQLIPQRKLARDLRVLIDPRLDLERAEHQLVLGKVVGDQLAVVRRVAAGREPSDHVLPLRGRHRQHQEQLGPRLAGQAHDDVVGDHRRGLAAGLARKLPEILAIVENLGAVHVVGAVHLRLDQEQVFRIADVLLQFLRHG